MYSPSNVLGSPLQCCCEDPMTGFYRDGYCRTGPGDRGLHTVCAQMTPEFLAFSAVAGNDLSIPMPEYDFPGLSAGDYWCVCVQRWVQAWRHGVVAPVHLEATHVSALEFVDLEVLIEHSVSRF